MIETADILEEFIEELIEQERSLKLREIFGDAK